VPDASRSAEGAGARAVLIPDRPEEGGGPPAALRADPTVGFVDPLEALRAELAAIRGVDMGLLEEESVWVYYPWRRTAVRLLGPRGYRAVRLDRNRNKITQGEQDSFATVKIAVVGLSVGHAIAHTLALEGLCGELRLCDFDTIELSNLNRIPATVLDLGVNKAIAAARRIAEMDPYLTVRVFTEGLNQANLADVLDGLDLVIEECDSLDMKLAVREAARARRIPVVMETSDRGLLDVERFDLEPERALFHGLLGETGARELEGLSTRDKVPHVLAILEPAQLSPRMAASMAEIDYTLSTWPQLGGDVTLGAATVAAVTRRLLRGEPVASGRARVDLDDVVGALATPSRPASAEETTVPAVAAGGRLPEDPVEAIVLAATLAPSGGNAQPWRFCLRDGAIDFAIEEGRTSAMDVEFRGSYVALGAALFNARVVASERGLLGPWRLEPEGREGFLATLEVSGGRDPELEALAAAVWSRRTNRGVDRRRPLDSKLVGDLGAAVAQEGGRLRVIDDPVRLGEIGELLGESDRMRYLDPKLHAEMISELRWPGEDMELGLDVRTLDLDKTDLAKLAVAGRADVMGRLASWDGGRALGETTRDRVSAGSGVLVVTIEGQGPTDYLLGGMALERAWLTAERWGVGLQPVSPVFIYACDHVDFARLVGGDAAPRLRALSDQFRALVGLEARERLVLVLRLTHAPPPEARSQRLPLEAVMRRAG